MFLWWDEMCFGKMLANESNHFKRWPKSLICKESESRNFTQFLLVSKGWFGNFSNSVQEQQISKTLKSQKYCCDGEFTWPLSDCAFLLNIQNIYRWLSLKIETYSLSNNILLFNYFTHAEESTVETYVEESTEEWWVKIQKLSSLSCNGNCWYYNFSYKPYRGFSSFRGFFNVFTVNYIVGKWNSTATIINHESDIRKLITSI